MRRYLFPLALAAAGACAHGDELGEAIDGVFADYRGNDGPGCAAGVVHRGQYVHKAGYGLANLEHGVPISSASVFRTGSVSKQFTAVAVAILAERGEIDLDADVHEYLTDLVDYGHTVTVRQMVHHLSGMGDYDHEVFNKADGSEFRFGNEEMVARVEPDRAPRPGDNIHLTVDMRKACLFDPKTERRIGA